MSIDSPEQLIGAFYDCALDNTDWSETLSGVADFCGAENAALVLADPRIRLSQVVTPRADPAVVNAYGEYWWEYDLTVQDTLKVAPGVITDLSITGRRRFCNSVFYTDFWSRSGLGVERLASKLFSDGAAFSSLVLQPGARRDTLDEDARTRFALLVPHAQRAVSTVRRMYSLELALSGGLNPAGDGVVLVDANGRVRYADAAAEALLQQTGPILRIEAGRVVSRDPGGTDSIARAIAACINPVQDFLVDGPLSFRCGPNDDHVTIRVQRLAPVIARGALGLGLSDRPVVALLLTHSGRRKARALALLERHWRLTPAEARLALEMLQGDGRAAAAARLGISINTARTHLGRVFEKAGVSRQAELIRKLSDLGLG